MPAPEEQHQHRLDPPRSAPEESHPAPELSGQLPPPGEEHIETVAVLRGIAAKTLTELTPEMKDRLHKEGLITSMTEEEYDSAFEDSLREPQVAMATEMALRDLRDLGDTVQDLSGKLNSRWHRFWSFEWLGSDRLERERKTLGEAEKRVPEANTNYRDLMLEDLRLLILGSRLAGMSRTDQGYVALTEQGRKMLGTSKFIQECCSD